MGFKSISFRLPIILSAVVILIAATWAGLIRLGWGLPVLHSTLPIEHGSLMVAGFFGTLISLERAVALNKRWAYTGPFLCGLGGLLLAFGLPGILGPALLTLGSFWLILIFIAVLQQHRTAYISVMAFGAFALFIGNLFWLLGWQVYQIVLWWAGFLILTIAGERLELARMVKKPDYSHPLFLAIIVINLAGLVIVLFQWDVGVRITGLGMLGMALWLLVFDIARRTVKQTGLTRYIAVCLLSGYIWLFLGGAIALFYGAVPAGPIYDAMLHTIFLGFVFTMIFGHAPIILPALLGLDIQYRPNIYFPLILLHLSLAFRIGGELLGSNDIRLWGGMMNVVAVLLYIGLVALNRALTYRE